VAQIVSVVHNVDQIRTSWCQKQKEQIIIVLDKVNSGTDLNFLDYNIQSIPVRPTTMSVIKKIMPLPLLGSSQLVTELFGSCYSSSLD
jgi:hypothetical protein